MSTSERYKKIISFILAFVMVVGTFAGSLPVTAKKVQAASNMKLQSIKKGTNITMIDPDYDPVTDQLITFKFNKKAGCKVSNMDNDLPPWIKKDGSTLPNVVFQNMDKANGNPTVTYYKVAKNKATGQYYDLRVTVTGWVKSKYTWKDPNGVVVPPFFAVSKSKIGFYMLGIDYVDCSFQYLIDGKAMSASEVSDFHSYVTLCDLDATQAFTIRQQPGLKGVFKMAGTDNISQNSDGLIVSADKWSGGTIDDRTQAGWVTAYMAGTDHFEISFHDEQKYATTYAPGSVHTRPLLNNIYPVSYHYGFSLQTLFTVPVMSDGILKKVGDRGVSWEEAETAESSDFAYPIDGYKEFDYLLQSGVDYGVDLQEYVITDTLENCLQIDDAAHVSITDKNEKNVTGQFEVSVDGQTITCSAKSKYLDSDEFKKNGQEFLVRLTVHRKKSEDIRTFMKEWIAEDGYTFYIPNMAKCVSTSAAGQTYEHESNECWVTDTIKAALKVEKDAKYDGWKTGDTVEYAVEVTQLLQDGYAVNVEVTDVDIPPYLQLLNNQWEVFGPQNGAAASISSVGENGWVVTCPLLQYGDSIVVKFKCRALEESNGKDTINTAKATAENFVDEDGEQIFTGDDAEVWVNTPELTVDKTANAYEYEVGDHVKYMVHVRNTKDYTIASNVMVSDISLPDGLEMTQDSVDGTGLTVNFTPESASTQIGWPVPDGTTAIAKQPKENYYMVNRTGNTWEVQADYLASNATMTITFDCIATKYVNGIESQNQVSVTADNFLDMEGNPKIAQDDAEVYVNTAAFRIDKFVTDGTYEWQVGDHVPFDIVVRNVNDENTQHLAEGEEYQFLPEEERARIGAAGKTVARNVIISDTDIPAGFKLDTGSVEVEAIPEENDILENEYQEEAEYPEEDIYLEKPEYPEEDIYLEEDNPEESDGSQVWEELPESTEGPDDGWYPEQGIEEIYPEESPEEVTCEEIGDTYAEEYSEGDMFLESSFEGLSEEVFSVEEELDDDLTQCMEATPYEEEYQDDFEEYSTEEYSEEVSSDESLWEEESYDTAFFEEIEALDLYSSSRPAEEMTVEGIPDSYEDHVAGTPDTTNQLNPETYNETVPTQIKWNLETMGNGWVLKINHLPAGYDVKVHFTCEALEASNGQEGVNIGTVTANNAITRSDDSEAYVNTAVLTIDKELFNRYAAGGEEDRMDGREPYEFRVGEDIVYRVTVRNIQPGSVARNLVISDLSLPEGLLLNEGEGAVTVEGIPQQYVNPIAGTLDADSQLDPDHYKETEILPVGHQLVREGTGWELFIDNMPCTENDTLNQWGQPVVVTFHCTATDAVNGWEIMNTAKALADNAAEVKDSERVWINSPDIKVVKNADKNEYLVGDTVTYTVDLAQEQIGCVARNVVISDVIATEGVKLQKNSIVLLDKEGRKFNIPDEQIEVQGNSFVIHTGMCLIKEQGYDHWDAENGGLLTKGQYNPIGVEKESRLTLEYAVEIVDRNLAGQTIYNKVDVNSDENIPKEDEEEVLVEGAELDIVKESDKAEYLVGENGVYKLTIRELREGVTAKNIVIRDSFDTEGVEVLTDTLSVRLNGEEIADAVITVNGNNFTIETGKDITVVDKIEVYYKVIFRDASLDGKYVTNTAAAKGTNTKEERQEHTVTVIDENPSLSIKKSSDKKYYKVGETGHYTVVVSQNTKGATARNVIIKDQMYIEGAKIVAGTILIRNSAGRILDEAEIESSDLRYTIYTGKDLEYGESFTVTYDVLFEQESLAGKDILNVARATCDNVKTETKDPGSIKVSDGLTVYKTAEAVTGSLVRNGDTITYHILVKNTSDADKPVVLVKDRIPEYTQYVLDSLTNDEKTVGSTIELDGKSYAAFVLQNLSAGEERRVSFSVLVKDAPQDGLILNVAQVRETKAEAGDITADTWMHHAFRNTNETVHYLDTRWVKDSNTVRIDGGSLSIEKTSDKANYAVGEIGHYTLTVTQRKEGAVSKNVIIKDSLKTEGVFIKTDTIRVTKGGQDLIEAEISAKENGFTIQTNTDLAYGEEIVVTYKVLFKDASLSGKNVKNVAVTKGDETPEGEEPKDDNTVTVGKAGLDIRKTSDKKVYQVGDIARYMLEVRTTADDFTAENVIIKDVMKQQGAHVVSGTVKVFLDEKHLDDVEVLEIENGFIIRTYENLYGTQVMKVTYDVTMEKASLAGRDIQNAATADADNTDPTETLHSVSIPKDSKPVEPENPEKPEKPSPTPVPEEKGEPILTISKKADRSEANPGSTVQYIIEVKNTGNATAEDVVVIDNLKNNKAILQKDTIKAYLQDKAFTPKKLSAVSSGFRMETGKNLEKGQVLRITYQVKLDATMKSSEIRNVASASAQNADRAEMENTLRIPSNTSDPNNPYYENNGNPKDTSSSLKGNVQTGDQSPVKLIVIVLLLGIAGLIAYFWGRKKGNDK